LTVVYYTRLYSLLFFIQALQEDLSEGSSAEDESEEEEEEKEEESERKRKWFEDSDSDSEQESNKKRIIDVAEPQTLEDQEALALKLLGA